mmetsp:Transcript_23859/g.56531  ORF Transcript_23859/g.56531 Transcript_23859/m.56531 type:complete len:255 (+) Transcript_23859:100-864(+)
MKPASGLTREPAKLRKTWRPRCTVWTPQTCSTVAPTPMLRSGMPTARATTVPACRVRCRMARVAHSGRRGDSASRAPSTGASGPRKAGPRCPTESSTRGISLSPEDGGTAMAPPPFLKPCSAALASAATWASTYTGCGTVRVRWSSRTAASTGGSSRRTVATDTGITGTKMAPPSTRARGRTTSRARATPTSSTPRATATRARSATAAETAKALCGTRTRMAIPPSSTAATGRQTRCTVRASCIAAMACTVASS